MKSHYSIHLNLTLILGFVLFVGLVYFFYNGKNLRSNTNLQVYQKEASVEPLDAMRQFEYVQVHMAMPVTLTVWAKNRQSAEVACKAAFDRITELEAVFSDYSNSSETGRFNQLPIGESMTVSRELAELLKFSKDLCQKTDGVFDPTMGVAIRVWRKARKTKSLPSSTEIDDALESGGFDTLQWQQASSDKAFSTGNASDANSVAHWRLKRLGGSSLDFGAVAKGYIGDQVLQSLRRYGIESACFEAGGDIVCSAAPPGSEGWEVELPKLGVRRFQHVGVAVSGDTNQFVKIDGKRYSHVIDLRNGQGVTTRRMSVVIANSGALSDALATTGCVMNEAEFDKLVTQFKNVEAISFRVKD